MSKPRTCVETTIPNFYYDFRDSPAITLRLKERPMTDEWTEADEVVEDIREIRRRIWARFDNDPEKVIDYYLELDR